MFRYNAQHTGQCPYDTSNNNGTLKWKYQTGGWIIGSSPAIASNGTIYIGSNDNYLHAINPDGTLKWRYQTGGWIYSSPAIASDGTIYVGSDDGYLYAIGGK
jgi:outer membrane protein assembly factor BamB